MTKLEKAKTDARTLIKLALRGDHADLVMPYNLSTSPREGLWRLAVRTHGTLGLLRTTKFLTYEFRSDSPMCFVSPLLIGVLYLFREASGGSVTINSGYRTWEHNSRIRSSASNSRHLYGKAADIVSSVLRPDDVADWFDELQFGGLGRYDSFTHFDCRTHEIARWDFRKESTG